VSRKEAIDFVVKSYDKISFSAPCSFVVLNDKEEFVQKYRLYVCHAPLRNIEPNVAHEIITSFPKAQALDIEYFNWLLQVPFKSIQEHVKFEQTEEGEYYIRIINLDKIPANLLFDFCIASRTHVEFPKMIEYWGMLCKVGVHPSLAFVVSAYIRGQYGNNAPKCDPMNWSFSEISVPVGHFWFNATCDWDRIFKGTPGDLSKLSYKKNTGSSTPCNIVWGTDTTKKINVYRKKTVRELSILIGFDEIKKVDPEIIMASETFELINDDDDHDDDYNDDLNWRD
jgi:hypothetical protein